MLPGFVAAAVGYVVFIGIGSWGGVGASTLSIPGLPLYDGTHLLDLLLAVAIGVGTGGLVSAVRTLGRRIDVNTVKRLGSTMVLLAGAAAVGLLAEAADLLGANPQDVLFSGQASMSALVGEDSTKIVLVLLVAKALAYAICLGCGFRGGPVFPAIFLGVALAALGIVLLDLFADRRGGDRRGRRRRCDDASAADLGAPRDAAGRLERPGRRARGGARGGRCLADGDVARGPRRNPRRGRRGHRGAAEHRRSPALQATAPPSE